jgi:hypothetical protein
VRTASRHPERVGFGARPDRAALAASVPRSSFRGRPAEPEVHRRASTSMARRYCAPAVSPTPRSPPWRERVCSCRSDADSSTSFHLSMPFHVARHLGTDSSQTHRWREMDSNLWFLTGKTETPPARNRQFESISLQRRVRKLSVPVGDDTLVGCSGAMPSSNRTRSHRAPAAC